MESQIENVSPKRNNGAAKWAITICLERKQLIGNRPQGLSHPKHKGMTGNEFIFYTVERPMRNL